MLRLQVSVGSGMIPEALGVEMEPMGSQPAHNSSSPTSSLALSVSCHFSTADSDSTQSSELSLEDCKGDT